MSIPFPSGARSFVSVGDDAEFGLLLYEMDRKKTKDSYYLPKILGIKAEDSGDYVGRISGEYVMIGDLLAEKLTAAGMIGKRVVAGTDGVLDLTRLKQGFIDILGEAELIKVESRIKGKIVGIELGRRITIECDAAKLSYTYAHQLESAHNLLSDEVSGELVLIGDGTSLYTAKDLAGSYEGKVVYSGRFIYPEVAREIYRKGAVALIVNAVDYFDMRQLTVPMVVMGGFGQVPVDTDVLSILQNSVGNYLKIDPSSRSIIIGNIEAIETKNFKGYNYFTAQLPSGSAVKVFESNSYGAVGEVVELMDDEDKVLVQMKGKKRILVDRNSVEPYVTKV